MGCGSSATQKVSPSITSNSQDLRPKEQKATPIECISKADDNKKFQQTESTFSSSDTIPIAKRSNSHSGSLKSSTESPKTGVKARKLIRDSRGSVRPASASSNSSELERQFSGDQRKREKTEKLFQANSLPTQEKPPLPPIGGNVNLKPLAFEVQLDTKPPKMRPPRRLESLQNAPKLLTQKDLEEKLKQSEERRELEIQRKKLKSSRMSRRKRDLIAAREQSKMEEQAVEIKEKMNLTTTNRERLQAETIEKQKKRREHAQMVRERAKQLKKRKDLDEGLGGEMETYKATSDDEDESIWSATDGKDRTAFLKTETSASIDSRASLDTVDSGVPTRNLDDSTEQFYNA